MLDYLSDPKSPRKLSKVFQVWRRGNTMLTEDRKTTDRISEYIKRLRQVEDYIWPGLTADWLQELASTGEPVESVELLAVFRQLVRRWQAAIFMPIDQLILTIAQDLLSDPGELALSHKLAVMLRSANQTHPTWQLPQLAIELEGISKNEQRFLGFSQDDLGFDPKKYKGIVVISTIHKAKGLEWDRVYLMSVNNYDFPSGLQYDQYIAEKLYIRDSLNLQAEALEQLRMTISEDEYRWYEEGRASNQARIDYVRERLRLLYVGITRAKRELVVTWNSGRDGNLSPAQPLQALFTFWEDTNTKTGNQ
jgi:DNA helicase-2/ATP-dependent DNA helicase PcrA